MRINIALINSSRPVFFVFKLKATVGLVKNNFIITQGYQ